jgi:pyruvate ferredoxin oxidoreductase gamma subunit
MQEIRLVGRGGHGVVTAGELLGQAALLEGRWAQAIPTFGPERRGALSSCTVRIGDSEILLKCSGTAPTVLVIFDATIWHHAPVTLGMVDEGVLVFNSPHAPGQVEAELRDGTHGYRLAAERCRFYTLDATAIALEHVGRAITNTTMMGALSGATGIVGMEAVERVLLDRFGDKASNNIEAARAGRDRLRGPGD